MLRFFLLMCLLTAALGAQGPGAAMVTAMTGKIGKLQLFDSLSAGRRLEIPAGSSLSLSFLEGGTRVHCTGPLRLQLTAAGVSKLGGSGHFQVQRPRAGMARIPGVRFNWDRMAGVKRDSLGWRGDPTQLPGAVLLRWEAPPDLDEIEVTVERLPGHQRVLRTVHPRLPAQLTSELPPGRYLLQLRGFSPRRTVEAAEQELFVLDEKTAREVASIEQRSQEDGSSEALVELCGYMLQMGLHSRAAHWARVLQTRYPDQVRLRQLDSL